MAAIDISTAAPTQTDAQILLQLAQLAQSGPSKRGQAVLWAHRETGGMTYEQFLEHDATSDEHIAVISTLEFYETVGTLVKQGLLHRGLVYDWLWVAGVWRHAARIVAGMRADIGDDRIWENFEALAAGQVD